TDTLLADSTNGINEPQDLALDPTGRFLYVANFLGNTITQIDLTTNTITPFISNFSAPEGMAFDASGKFYAVRGSFVGTSQVCAITGGVVVRCSPAFDPTNSLDGMVFDPFSGFLYVTSQKGNTVYKVDPATLTGTALLDGVGNPIAVPAGDGVITNFHG